MELHQELKNRFGFDQFRSGQEEVIRSILGSNDTIAILPTGMGKSLCYQLPGEMMDGLVLIVSPLVSLMEDQVASIRKRGEKRVAALNSFLSSEQRKSILDEIHKIKFLFISPEMISRPDMTKFLIKLPISILVVDEAHCISQWGFDFRPDYLRLGEFIRSAGNPPVLALTATADARVEADIIHYLYMTDPNVIRQSLDRPNLTYTVQQLESETDKTAWLKERLKTTKGPGIIYVASRKRAEELTHILQQEGIAIASYHAGKEAGDRNIIQQQFLSGEIAWICATNAFGMGIHKDDIRQVIHDQITASAAAYVQEAGRAGRDGERSAAVLLYVIGDEQKVRFIVQHDLPDEPQVRHFVAMRASGQSLESSAELSGISETGFRILQYYLETHSVEDVLKVFTKLKYDKEEKLRQMITYAHAKSCLREQLLSYFDETSQIKHDRCCSVCGTAIEDWLLSNESPRNLRSLLPWEERIRLLLC
ncbi:RecQ family ATP-dependent DNA helicase [Sporosarcina gallistercoris]|uniref:ATP-dependent DNA helicase RecQ n=1 Tax=Sporosarcina gallistercoris TaxID=2762245 RepID=A0ABR8PFQ8_9BACL|nr:ATP-dependent DNA helicase RecQ [Sporosarcina gallistercoris]MBD7906978.1 ATP-dependent DNA helicase RecQ [Sporosarcina gallistercoris]